MEPPGRIVPRISVSSAFTAPPTEVDGTSVQGSAGPGRAAQTGIASTSGPTIHPVELPLAAVDARRPRLKPRDKHVSIDLSIDVSTDTPT